MTHRGFDERNKLFFVARKTLRDEGCAEFDGEACEIN